jgi:hypothetical protein
MPLPRYILHEDNVFINCPFDDEYRPLLQALTFAIHDCGFVARCAYEFIGSGKTRLTRISEIIKECKYGIHDISRTELSKINNLPRFNMPFEAGLFWGCLIYGGKKQSDKEILVLDNKEFRYQETLSDISGQDIKVHSNDPKTLINITRTWLRNISKINMPGGEDIWKHYEEFNAELPGICENLKITKEELTSSAYFADYIYAIKTWLMKKGY